MLIEIMLYEVKDAMGDNKTENCFIKEKKVRKKEEKNLKIEM